MTNDLELFSRSAHNIWTDPYIAKNMLLAHLDYDHDGASRNIKTIRKTVEWIVSESVDRKKILDLGCGPGIYANEFAKKGFGVKGIDISDFSIQYAKRWTEKEKTNIDYECVDYVRGKIEGEYDIATCIYCDFGALVPNEQVSFLKNVFLSLGKNGLFFFDVFGYGLSKTRKEYRIWSFVEKGNFWSEKPHFELHESVHFKDEHVWGTRAIIVESKKEPKEYITWDHCYSESDIQRMLSENGFDVLEIKNGLVSTNEFTSDDVMFIKAIKK